MSASSNAGLGSDQLPARDRRLPAIDGMRAMAALMVFFYHSWQFSGFPTGRTGPGSIELLAPIGQFTSGVDVFIVLSGLCLFLPYVDSSRPWDGRSYTTRRLWRIVPPYYAAIAFCTVLPTVFVIAYKVVGHPAHWQSLPDWQQYAAHLTFTQTLFPATWNGIQGAFWTIGLEAQLYLVFPLLVLGYRRWGIRVAWATIALSVAYMVAITPLTQRVSYPASFLLTVTFLGRWMEFGTGMLLAWVIVHLHQDDGVAVRTRAAIARVPGFLWVPVGLGCMALGFWEPVYGVSWVPVRELVFSAGTALLIVGTCMTDSRTGAPWRWRPLVALGLISYSFYLIHQNLIFYFSQFADKSLSISDPYARLVLAWTVGFGVVLVVALVFYRLIERPSTAIGRTRSKAAASRAALERAERAERAGPAGGAVERDPVDSAAADGT
jgi:peptidoglycan/LPS O-acetylase OafA/YrhL